LFLKHSSISSDSHLTNFITFMQKVNNRIRRKSHSSLLFLDIYKKKNLEKNKKNSSEASENTQQWTKHLSTSIIKCSTHFEMMMRLRHTIRIKREKKIMLEPKKMCAVLYMRFDFYFLPFWCSFFNLRKLSKTYGAPLRSSLWLLFLYSHRYSRVNILFLLRLRNQFFVFCEKRR